MEEVKRNSLQAWILAARPKTLTGAITPVMIEMCIRDRVGTAGGVVNQYVSVTGDFDAVAGINIVAGENKVEVCLDYIFGKHQVMVFLAGWKFDEAGHFGVGLLQDVYKRQDFILITHEHGDHFDTKAIAAIETSGTRIIANPNCRKMLNRGQEMKNGDVLQLADDMKLEAVPAYNTTPGRDKFHPKGRDNLSLIHIYILLFLAFLFSGTTLWAQQKARCV